MTDREKELELRERELAIKERELKLQRSQKINNAMDGVSSVAKGISNLLKWIILLGLPVLISSLIGSFLYYGIFGHGTTNISLIILGWLIAIIPGIFAFYGLKKYLLK